MSRTSLFAQLRRTLRLAHAAEKLGRPADEVLGAAREGALGRRDLLRGGAAAGAAMLATSALAGCAADAAGGGDDASTLGRARSALPRATGSVAIIGAGLAGLSCAYEMKRAGLTATIYEASDRAGGRCWSMGGSFGGPVTFPGQVIERGGELIDTAHATMKAYANEFGLTLTDINKEPGEAFYRVGGQTYSEATVVEQYRVLVDAMRDDLRTVGSPTAASFTASDAALDRLSLREYLRTRNAPPVIRAVVDTAYTIEYGLDADQLSCLSFLLFIHADRRSKFAPWGVFSDERYHIVGGNQQVAKGLADRLPGQIQYGRALAKVAKLSDGRVQLTLREGTTTRTVTHDAVVIAIPFSVLRDVTLDASVGLPPAKVRAIQQFRMGTNAKMMIGFSSRPWIGVGSNGASYSDMPNHQTSWETDALNATATRGILTDYSGGARGASLDPSNVQAHAAAFLTDLDKIFPGANAAATRDKRGNVLAHLEAWPRNPLTKGSYSANQIGYFTTIADQEAVPVGNVFFAGEHTSSFYEWQGFMEGAALSGLRAAGEVSALLAGKK
ncbi:MAG: amine oxidase [Labilithrix sp.]|nr:amine oxidase [Labilithrix sp.]